MCATRQSVQTLLSFINVSSGFYLAVKACHNLCDIVVLIQGTLASYLPSPLPPNTYKTATTPSKAERQKHP